MGLVMTLKQAPAETLDLLVARPELAVVFWMDPGYTPKPQPAWVRWVARTLGGYTPPMELPAAPPELTRDGDVLKLESHSRELNAIMSPSGSGVGLLNAGEPLDGTDHGHGEDQVVRPARVRLLGDLLERDDVRQRVASDEDRDLHDAFGRLQSYIEATCAKSLGCVTKLS